MKQIIPTMVVFTHSVGCMFPTSHAIEITIAFLEMDIPYKELWLIPEDRGVKYVVSQKYSSIKLLQEFHWKIYGDGV